MSDHDTTLHSKEKNICETPVDITSISCLPKVQTREAELQILYETHPKNEEAPHKIRDCSVGALRITRRHAAHGKRHYIRDK